MKKISCVIIEDEAPALEELKFILNEYDEIFIAGEAFNGKDGFDVICKLRPKVVFLDINIPICNGMELARKIKNIDNSIEIIFITAYEKHALEAFEVEAIDYILKPFDERRIGASVKRLKNNLNRRSYDDSYLLNKVEELMVRLEEKNKGISNKIPCESNGKYVIIDVKDIIFCYSEVDKAYVKTKDKVYCTNFKLHEIEAKTNFFRAHRSYVVNLDKVKELYPWFNGTYKIVMDDLEKSEIPISRGKVKSLKELIGI